jgi:hypothetical protein
MATKWHYSRDGQESGPVSSADLKRLASKGALLRTDYLWKEGMAEWKLAGEFPGLFPAEEPATIVITPEEPAEENPFASLNLNVGGHGRKQTTAKATSKATESLASLKLDVKTASRKATQAVKTHAKVAGKVASLTAERTKISTITLPLAYAELGEHCYQSRTHEEEFAELFAKLDAVQGSFAEGEQRVVEKGETVAETAMAWAEQGMNFAKSQAQGVQAKTLFVQLGKACFNQFGPQAGPEEIVAKVQSLQGRLAKLNSEIDESVKSTGGIKTWLVYGGGALLCFAIIGAVFGEKEGSVDRPRGRGNGGAVVRDGPRKGGTNTHNKGTSQDNLVGCPRGSSDLFKQGWGDAIWFVKSQDSRCRQSHDWLIEELRTLPSVYHEEHRATHMQTVLRCRVEVEEKLRMVMQVLEHGGNDPKYDWQRGNVAGYQYGLRYILKQRY